MPSMRALPEKVSMPAAWAKLWHMQPYTPENPSELLIHPYLVAGALGFECSSTRMTSGSLAGYVYWASASQSM